jgi:hypothetical protein
MTKFVLFLCVVLLPGIPCLAAETNLLQNADFTKLNDKGVPAGWGGARDAVSVTTADLPTGRVPAVAIKIGTTGGGLGQLGQRVAVKPGWNYRIQAYLKGETPRLGLLQVKLLHDGRELKRFDVGGKSTTDWTLVQTEFVTPRDADGIEFLCRYERGAASQGKTVEFAGLGLFPLGAKKFVAPHPTKLTAVATFESVGVSLAYEGDASNDARCALRYRVKGEARWRAGLDLVPRPTERQFRGSVLGLQPSTDYEIECDLSDPAYAHQKPLTSGPIEVRTWPEEVPIARTVRLPAGVSKQPLVISDKGTEDGWILYTSAAGEPSTLDVGKSAPTVVSIQDAAYVILENVTIRGGAKRGVHVVNSNHVRVRRCDIAGWGEPGTRSKNVEHGRYVDQDGKLINYQAGVQVSGGCSQVVVEGNFIHAPRGTANSWADGHPAGPQAVILDMTSGNNVVRDNELIGNERHWWNDAIESMYNEKVGGGPYRDTDISGNVIAFANDDGTELDGGQINVRFFNNWTQWTFCGISCAPNLAGPSYVFRNLFVVTGEQRKRANYGFKMGSGRFADPGRTFLLHNTMVSTSSGLSSANFGPGATPITARNNAYLSGEVYLQGAVKGNYDFDYDLIQRGALSPPDAGLEAHAVIGAPTFIGAKEGDYRLAPASKGLDAAVRLAGVNDDFTGSGPDMGAFERGLSEALFPRRQGGISALPLMNRLQAPIGGKEATASVHLIVPAKNGARWTAYPNADWIQCEPAGGAANGKPQTVVLRAKPSNLAPGEYRGAVTFRTDAGYCRTVLVAMQVRAQQPVAVNLEAEAATLAGGFTPVTDPSASGGVYLQAPADKNQKWGPGARFSFDVPADGVYYVLGRIRVPGPLAMNHDSLFVAMDDQPNEPWHLQYLGAPDFHWLVVSLVNREQDARAYHLSKGRHTLTVGPRESLTELDAVRVSNEPFLPWTPAAQAD